MTPDASLICIQYDPRGLFAPLKLFPLRNMFALAVHVDGEPIGLVRAGETRAWHLPPSAHIIRFGERQQPMNRKMSLEPGQRKLFRISRPLPGRHPHHVEAAPLGEETLQELGVSPQEPASRDEVETARQIDAVAAFCFLLAFMELHQAIIAIMEDRVSAAVVAWAVIVALVAAGLALFGRVMVRTLTTILAAGLMFVVGRELVDVFPPYWVVEWLDFGLDLVFVGLVATVAYQILSRYRPAVSGRA